MGIFKMFLKYSLVYSILYFASRNVHSQTAKYSNEFLSIGVGAKAMALGNTSVASSNDIYSGYWNPAGLTAINKKFEVGIMHAEYFAGIAKYDFGGFATRIDSHSVVGLSIMRFGIDDIPNTTQLIDNNGNIDYDRITSFSAADYAFLISYARTTPKIPGLRYGVNVKIIRRVIGDFASAWGFGFDGGAQYAIKKWKFGILAQDITSTFNAWKYTLAQETIDVFNATQNEIPENGLEITPPKWSFGMAFHTAIYKKINLQPEVNLDFTFDGQRNTVFSSKTTSMDPKVGLSIDYNKMVFLRGGVRNFQQVTDVFLNDTWSYEPSIGIGIVYKGIALDYALTSIGKDALALYSNVFSLRFEINQQQNRSPQE